MAGCSTIKRTMAGISDLLKRKFRKSGTLDF
jgi:hypothetical protein